MRTRRFLFILLTICISLIGSIKSNVTQALPSSNHTALTQFVEIENLEVIDKGNSSNPGAINSISNNAQFKGLSNARVLTIGLFFGLLLVIMVYAIFIYFNVHQRSFLWFAIYVLLISIMIGYRTGLLSQLMKLKFTNPSSGLVAILITFTLISFIRFTQLFFDSKNKFERLHLVLWGVVIVRIIIQILSVFSINPIVNGVLEFSRIGMPISVGITAFFVWRNYSKATIVFWLFILSFLAVIVGGVNLSLADFEIITEIDSALIVWYLCAILHVVFLSFGIAYRVRAIATEREELNLKTEEAKKGLIDAYLNGVKEEKTRVSTALHSEVLADITRLQKRLTSHPQVHELVHPQLVGLTADIKKISSDLVGEPKELGVFESRVHNLVSQHNSSALKINLSWFNFSKPLTQEQQKNLFRILQEAIENIEKYAKASSGEVQFFQYHNEIVMTIEDDGIGYDTKKHSDGIGLKNIQLRVNQMDGMLKISTSPGHGVSIMVMVKV